MAWPLITADSHHNVPLDLVDELPAKYRQYLPRIEQREDGAYLVRPRFAAAAKRKKDRKAANQVLDQMTAALSDGIKVDGLDERQLRQMVMGDCGPLASPAPTPEERLVDMA